MAKYWAEACLFDPKMTPLHEALHVATSQILGGEVREISLNKDGSGQAYTQDKHGWKTTAVCLAPALIGDMSEADADYVGHQNPYRRGYAWGWLKKNRGRIMRRAKKIAAEIGRPPGKLKWDPETSCWRWKPRKRRQHCGSA